MLMNCSCQSVHQKSCQSLKWTVIKLLTDCSAKPPKNCSQPMKKMPALLRNESSLLSFAQKAFLKWRAGNMDKYAKTWAPHAEIWACTLNYGLLHYCYCKLKILNLTRRNHYEHCETCVNGRRSETYRCLQRSEEHTSELQSRFDLVCRLLLEKKKKKKKKKKNKQKLKQDQEKKEKKISIDETKEQTQQKNKIRKHNKEKTKKQKKNTKTRAQ